MTEKTNITFFIPKLSNKKDSNLRIMNIIFDITKKSLLKANFLFSNTIFFIYKFQANKYKIPLILPTIVYYITWFILKYKFGNLNNEWYHYLLLIGIFVKTIALFFDKLKYELKIFILCLLNAIYSLIEFYIEGNDNEKDNREQNLREKDDNKNYITKNNIKNRIIDEFLNFIFIIIFNYNENKLTSNMGFYINLQGNIFILTFILKWIIYVVNKKKTFRNRNNDLYQAVNEKSMKKYEPLKNLIFKFKKESGLKEELIKNEEFLLHKDKNSEFLISEKIILDDGNFDKTNLKKDKSHTEILNRDNLDLIISKTREKYNINKENDIIEVNNSYKILLRINNLNLTKILLIISYILTNISEMYIYYIFIIRNISTLALYFSIDAIFKLILIPIQSESLFYFLVFKFIFQISLLLCIVRINPYYFVTLMFLNGITSEILYNTFDEYQIDVKFYDFIVFIFVIFFIFNYGIGQVVSEFIFFSSVKI
ncbi:hypothetical protein DMUE_2095 [Dictyocoela muelleri]|nr:hypothetical protein DMUE_2095 [Dictyocoela muelleri]